MSEHTEIIVSEDGATIFVDEEPSTVGVLKDQDARFFVPVDLPAFIPIPPEESALLFVRRV